MPAIARKHELTVREDHFKQAASGAYLTGDKLGMHTPAGPRTEAHEKTRVSQTVRENTSFLHVVDILENAQMAGTGFEPATSRL